MCVEARGLGPQVNGARACFPLFPKHRPCPDLIRASTFNMDPRIKSAGVRVEYGRLINPLRVLCELRGFAHGSTGHRCAGPWMTNMGAATPYSSKTLDSTPIPSMPISIVWPGFIGTAPVLVPSEMISPASRVISCDSICTTSAGP